MARVEVDARVEAAVAALMEHQGADYTAGFLTSQLVAAVELLPKNKQALFLNSLDSLVGDKVTVKVRSLMSGQEVEIPWDQVGSCTDPSTERYWSM